MEKAPSPLPQAIFDEYKLRGTLEAAQDELISLLKERDLIEWRINKLQNDIVHLAALCRVEVEDPIRQLGLTDAVRWIFARERDKELTARQVLGALQTSWHDAPSYKNLHANVITVVRRLLKAGEIKPSSAALPMTPPGALGRIDDDEDAAYVWGGGLPPLPPNLKELLKSGKTIDQ
jgi:hypothetical protein